jgi:hypothetical protein
MLQAVAYDETFDTDGTPRAAYAEPLAALAAVGAGAVVAPGDIALGAGSAAVALPLDPVPRIFTAQDVADIYGEQRAVAQGVVPGGVLETCPYYEPQLPPLDTGVAIVGFDVVRLPDGSFAVMEDNVLTPGHAAVPAARERLTLWRHVAPHARPVDVREATRRLLRGLVGDGGAILGDDPATWELEWLARFLDVPLVHPADLRGARRVWQRTGEDRLWDDAGALNPLGRALLPRLRDRTLEVVSRPGCGVADDKALLPHVPDLIRLHLGEEPLLAQVPSGDVAEAAADPQGWVFKPRNGAGGRGVVFDECPDDLDDERWVVQRAVPLSLHPTVTPDGPEARPVDLRAFAVRTADGGFEVLPGGVSRFAPSRDTPIVNTSAGGGVKDVWVLA